MMTAPITAPAEMAFLRAVEVMPDEQGGQPAGGGQPPPVPGDRIGEGTSPPGRPQEGFHPEENAPLRQLMNPNPPCCRPEDSIVSLLKTVNDADLATLPVVDEEGILRGLITKGSLVSTLSQQFITEKEGSAHERILSVCKRKPRPDPGAALPAPPAYRHRRGGGHRRGRPPGHPHQPLPPAEPNQSSASPMWSRPSPAWPFWAL